MVFRRCVFAAYAVAVVVVAGSGCSAQSYMLLPPTTSAAPSPPMSIAPRPPQQVLNGVYTTMAGPTKAQWTITSTCSAGGCTAVISSSNGGWTGNATLSGGQWAITVVRPDGVTCADGTTVPSTNLYSWDATTLMGAVDSSHDTACVGQPAGTFHDTFTIVTPPVSSP